MRYSLSLIILNLIVLFSAEGQISFKPNVGWFPDGFNVGFNTYPYEMKDVEVADLNNDGKQDLIYISAKKISVLIASDHGIFKTPVVSTVYSDISSRSLLSFEIGYFNNDAYPDLLIMEDNGSNFSVWLNDGSGQFEKLNSIFLGNANYNYCLGDFNKDDKVDIAVSIYSSSKSQMRIYTGDGNGNFSQSYSFNVISGRFHVDDYNNDGIPDIAIAGFDKKISVYISNGIFEYENTEYPTKQYINDLTSGDFDGDGIIDIAGGAITVGVVLYKGKGDGKFMGPVEYPNGNVGEEMRKINLDEDEKDELISIRGQCVTICQFSPEFNVVSYNVSITNLYEIAIADVNNDNVKDIITASMNRSNSSIVRGNANGTLNAPYSYPGFYNIALGDGDLDGKNDVLVREPYGSIENYLAWYKLDEHDVARVQNKMLFKNLSHIHIGDVNGDKKDDILIHSSDSLKYSPILSDFKFSSFTFLDTLKGSIRKMISEDVTGDNIDDLLICYFVNNRYFFRMYKSQPDGTYSSEPLINNVSTIGLADFNNDGYKDIIYFFYEENEYRLGLNDKGGNFIITDSFKNIRSNFFIGDIDRNGVPDLVVKDGLYRMSIYYWIESKFVKQSVYVYSPVGELYINGVADLDNDGDDDVITNWSHENEYTGSTRIHSLEGNVCKEVFFYKTDWFALGWTFDLNNDDRIDLIQETNTGFVFYFNSSDIVRKPVISNFSPKNVRAGDKVTVKGINFSDAVELSVGEEDIDFSIKDKNTIEFIAPSGFVSGTLTVTNSSGKDETPYLLREIFVTSVNLSKTETFRIFPNPAESVISMTGLNVGEEIKIYNVLGIECKNIIVEDSYVVVDVEGFKDGIYNVCSSGRKLGKFVVVK
ncbi:MAG: FG-GAP-like repeat-containing protein [Sporocytophaga sp.]|nr:FG-GAP-like repeat-containing protein [Sporocytophaga sp.]